MAVKIGPEGTGHGIGAHPQEGRLFPVYVHPDFRPVLFLAQADVHSTGDGAEKICDPPRHADHLVEIVAENFYVQGLGAEEH